MPSNASTPLAPGPSASTRAGLLSSSPESPSDRPPSAVTSPSCWVPAGLYLAFPLYEASAARLRGRPSPGKLASFAVRLRVSPRLAFLAAFATFSSLKYSFSANKIAVPVSRLSRAARPKRCQRAARLHVALHWITIKISGCTYHPK